MVRWPAANSNCLQKLRWYKIKWLFIGYYLAGYGFQIHFSQYSFHICFTKFTFGMRQSRQHLCKHSNIGVLQSVMILSLPLCHSQSYTLSLSDSSCLLSVSLRLSLGLSPALRLHIRTCLIGCSPWAAVESPPAASDRQRQSCLGQTCLLLLPPNVSVWTAASQRMDLVHEWVFKCVCLD